MGTPSIILRAWRVPLRYAVILVLPILALWAWMVFSAYTDYCKYASTAYGAPPISVDIIRLFLHDGIKREFLKLEAQRTPDDAPLLYDLRGYLDSIGADYDGDLANEFIFVPEVRLRVAPHHLASLNSDLPASGREYVPATIETSEGRERAKVRYRGDTEPHWLYRQKSLRVKLKKGKTAFGTRTFNLINFLRPVLYIEGIAQRLAAESGLLAPRCFPVRVFLNEQYYGLLLFHDQVDETLLRRNNRMPGNIHRGDINFDKEHSVNSMAINPKTGAGALWEGIEHWEKDGSRNAESENDVRDLDLLLQAVNNHDQAAFLEFCDTYLDHQNFVTFLALNMFTGSPHHDFVHNHKLYFDPYRGRFEQISWDDKGFFGNREIDPTLNPLAHRWRLSPLNENDKHRRLLQLLNSHFASRRVLGMLVALHEATEVAQRQDANRDWVALDGVFNKLSRPYTMDTYQIVLERIVGQVLDREKMLRSHLDDSSLRFAWNRGSGVGTIELFAVGPIGARLKSIDLTGSIDRFELYRDSNLSGIFDPGDELVGRAARGPTGLHVDLNEPLYPGLKKIEHNKPVSFFGSYDLQASPLVYRYFYKSSGTVTAMSLRAENLVTGGRAAVEEAEIGDAIDSETLSLHPWALAKPLQNRVLQLGPGKVVFTESQVFDLSTEVHIAPGTDITMASGVSLFFEGRVVAKGLINKPIRFVSLTPDSHWGVIAVIGEGSDGSVFENCQFSGGSVAERNLMHYSGMVSVRNSRNVTFSDCVFGVNQVGDDMLHYAYASGAITSCRFNDAHGDAFDADISRIKVVKCSFQNSGNDGLDLMTSSAVVEGCVFFGSGDKGVSVGERTNVAIRASTFDNCHIGIEVKDESRVVVTGSTIAGSEVPVNLYRKNLRYVRGGTLVIDQQSATLTGQGITSDRHSRVVIVPGETTK